jgi:hypothetical protein
MVRAKKKPEPTAVYQAAKPDPEPPIAQPGPQACKPDMNQSLKIAAVAILAVLVLALVWHFISMPPAGTFVPGPGVDAAAFQSAFINASRVYVVMDVRGVNGTVTSTNILQCGVDFSGSSGMGGKKVTYLSLSDSGCMEAALGGNGSVEENANQTVDSCISQLDNGMVIYVEPGTSSYYYSNALVVGIGSNYTAGTCGIRRA